MFFSSAVALFLILSMSGCRSPRILDSLEAALPQENDRPVLLVFFSPECPSCYDDLLEMIHFIDKNSLSIHVIGVSGNPKEDLVVFAEKYSVRCPIVLDRKRRIRRRFGVDISPFKIILKENKVVYKDDDYQSFEARREEAKRCLLRLG